MLHSKIFLSFLALLSILFPTTDCLGKVEVKKEKIGDIELAYYTRGSGDPLIMIMGFRGTMAVWDPALLENLEKKFKLILFDNRGAGFSTDAENNRLTISQMADDTAQLIKMLGYQKANVLGWSMGSRVAMELALNHPESVENLILCAPNPGGQHQAARKLHSYSEFTAKELTPEKALSLLFPDTSEGKKAAISYITRLTEAITFGSVPDDIQVSNETVKKQEGALVQWDENNTIYESLPNIKIPTLVAGGLNDVLDQPENVRIIASRIPFAWSAYFNGSGHNFLSQEHKNFAELVTLFIESNKPASKMP